MLRSSLTLTALALLVMAGAARAGVGVGHSGWEWSNPLPQGNTIRSLDFAGARGYAAGQFGTLLRTDDAGGSWSALSTGVTDDLVRVRVIGPDSLVVAGGCAARRSDDGGATFTRLHWTDRESSCRVPIASLEFPSLEVGYLLLEDGRFYRSGDGGESWNRMTDLPGTAATGGTALAADVDFNGQDTGVVATADGLFRTADGGFSWSRVAARTGGFAALALSGSQGYAAGARAGLYRTLDGGLTWTPLALPIAGTTNLGAIACSAQTCLAAGERGETVVRTRDAGATWTAIAFEGGHALAVGIASADRVIAAGSAGALALSDDAGASWRAQESGLAGSFARLSGESASLAFALGRDGVLARTTDGGQSWERADVTGAGDLIDVSFHRAHSGYALDAGGRLFHGDGRSWRQLDVSGQPQAVQAFGYERLLVAGPRGVARSTDGGRSFTRARRPAVRRATLFELDRAGGWLFVYGPTALFASRDGGRSWRKLPRPDHRPLALGKGGRVWRTRDRGRRWRELLAAGTDGGLHLAFNNSREGFLLTNDLFFAKGSDRPDYVLRTSDGGRSWRPQLVADTRDMSGLIATRDGAALALAGKSMLFSAIRGGDSGRRSALRLSGPRRALARAGRVRITGRLRPARGGEQITLSKTAADRRFRQGSVDWDFKSVRARRDGRFATTWTVRRTSVFVAQWTGDDRRSGAGSRILKVRVRRALK